MADNKITAQRVKPKGNYCNCCLKRRPDGRALVELHFCNYGCDFKVTLCDACLRDAYKLGMKAAESKGDMFTKHWEEE